MLDWSGSLLSRRAFAPLGVYSAIESCSVKTSIEEQVTA